MEEVLDMKKKLLNSPTKIKDLLQQITNTHFESDKVSQKLGGKLFVDTFELYTASK